MGLRALVPRLTCDHWVDWPRAQQCSHPAVWAIAIRTNVTTAFACLEHLSLICESYRVYSYRVLLLYDMPGRSVWPLWDR